MTPKQKLLRECLFENGLSRVEFARMIGVSVHTLDGWFCNPTTKKYREPSDQIMELVKYKIKDFKDEEKSKESRRKANEI